MEEGNQVALGEIDERDKSLMTVKIGNIAPLENITIQIAYVQ